MADEQIAQWIQFDDVHVDVTGRRLFVGGNETPLEPKVFDVLAFLAQRPGRALKREEIIDAVWGHRHLTPGVLNRAIALIRQALKANRLNRQYLHTLHGKGYRLDFSGPTEINVETDHFVDPQHSENLADSQTEAALADIDAASLTFMPRNESAGRPIHRMNHRSRTLAILAALLIVLCSTGFIVTLTMLRHSANKETLAPTLVVLPLNAVGDDKDESNVADGLSEELITRLTQIEGLRLISSTSAARAKRDRLDAQQLADQLHVTHALEGSLRHERDVLRIDLRLIETPSGQTLWAQTYDRKLTDVFALQQEIAEGVASTLAMRIAKHQSTKLDIDPQVFLKFLQLRHIFASQLNVSDKNESDLHALAAAAPNFAPVHGLLALNLASDFEPHTDADVIAEADLALKLDPESIYAHAALGELACRLFDWVACMEEFRIALVLNPSDSIIRLVYGMWCANLGHRDRALLQFETAYALDPLNYWTNYQLGTQLDVLGRHDEAKRYLDALTSLDPDSDSDSDRTTTTARWLNAAFRHDFTGAQAMVKLLPNDKHLQDAYVTTTRALQDPSRLSEAEAAIELRESELNDHIWLRMFLPRPDVIWIPTMFEKSLRGRDLFGRYFWATALPSLREFPQFNEMLDRTHIRKFWQKDGFPAQCDASGGEVVCK